MTLTSNQVTKNLKEDFRVLSLAIEQFRLQLMHRIRLMT